MSERLRDSDAYDAVADVWKSVAWAYQHIRARMRDGGPGWRPTPMAAAPDHTGDESS